MHSYYSSEFPGDQPVAPHQLCSHRNSNGIAKFTYKHGVTPNYLSDHTDTLSKHEIDTSLP
jgi:hypothetical protein